MKTFSNKIVEYLEVIEKLLFTRLKIVKLSSHKQQQKTGWQYCENKLKFVEKLLYCHKRKQQNKSWQLKLIKKRMAN